ncbi:glycosyltransferase family 8 protein [Pseudanabaena biceps]|nr:glycosyltransferase family 8 protein [Pseudanabaena biceps]
MQIDLERIEIVTACDDNYVQHLAVMLCSLLENTLYREKINIWVIDGAISQDKKIMLSTFISNKYQIFINYLNVDEKPYKNFKLSYHFTHSIYYRISIPEIIPFNINKVIYLDSDMVLKQDIYNLWLIDLKDCFIGAIELLDVDKRHLKGIIKNDLDYFNSGVLVMNINKWRENNVSQQVIDFISNYQEKIIWWDQDSLNAVLYQKWLSLPLKWNLQTNFFDVNVSKCARGLELREAIAKPAIIHYTGMHKPWDYIDNHPYKQEYYKYLALTPWHSYKSKKNPKLIVKRLIRTYTPRFFLLFIKQLFQKVKL